MQIKLEHPYVKYLIVVLGCFLAIGSLLDAISNSISLITPSITYVLTVLLVLLAIITHLVLKKRPLKVISKGGNIQIYDGLDIKHSAYLLGVILILWIPRAFELLATNSQNNQQSQSNAESEKLTTEAQKKFYVRIPTSLIFDYPGSILYVYTSKFGQLIAPVGYAAVVEVANNRNTITKIQSLVLEIEYGQEWVRLHHLPLDNPLSTYWVRDADLSKCTQLDFSNNSFDIQAKAKELMPGQSVRGWVFFEWPPELRGKSPHIKRIRVKVENTQGEEETILIDSPRKEEEGKASMEGGGIRFLQKDAADLSQLKIMPHMDLLRGFREGTLK